MSLRQLRDRLSALQALIAAITVIAGGGMTWASFGATVGLGIWAFYRPLSEEPAKATARMWTAGILIALAATLTRVFVRGDILDAGVDFLLLLIVQRLFNRQRAREHMQLLLLGLLMMVVGAVINTGLNFPILFAAYLVVAVMTLIVNHLMAEGERLGVRVMAEASRAAIRSRTNLWRAAAGVAMLAAVGALLVFFLFPRWGAGVFLRGAFARETRSGFSGEVQLGEFGRIKTDTTVAARLRPLDGKPRGKRLTWHLRGSAFNIYENGRWSSKTDTAERVPLRAIGPYSALAPEGKPLLQPKRGRGRGRGNVVYEAKPRLFYDSEQIEVDVILEDLGVDVMFVASEPLAVRLNARGALEKRDLKVRAGRHREFRLSKPPGPSQYVFVAHVGEPNHAGLRTLGDPEHDEMAQGYLQRSDDLSEEVTRLAQTVTAGATNRYDKVDALVKHLAQFDYTTNLEVSSRVTQGADPIEGFLFDTQAGHCEYFASALAVLGREVGIPTRIVNGYYGAHYNALGDFYAVRQADAHSWVEVWFGPDVGWVTFDPTPPSGRVAGDDAPLVPALTEALDAMRNAYLEYVIDYNLSKQLGLLEGLGMRSGGKRPRVLWKSVAAWFVGIAIVLLAWRLWRRKRRPRTSDIERIYEDVLKWLRRAGAQRRPDESATALARRLAPRLDDPAPLARFAERYDRLRFGPDAPPEEVAQLREDARAVRTSKLGD